MILIMNKHISCLRTEPLRSRTSGFLLPNPSRIDGTDLLPCFQGWVIRLGNLLDFTARCFCLRKDYQLIKWGISRLSYEQVYYEGWVGGDITA